VVCCKESGEYTVEASPNRLTAEQRAAL
jgi:hypothetical protein